MKKNESIKKIMITDVTTITLNDPLSEVRKIFIEQKGNHLPVVEGEKLLGLLSFTDFQKMDSSQLYNQDEKQADALLDNLSSVKEAMTRNLVTLKKDSTVRDATEILAKNHFHSLPVVEDSKLVGLVTTTDLLQYFLRVY